MIGIITSVLGAVGSTIASTSRNATSSRNSSSSSRRSSVSLSGNGSGYNEASCYTYGSGNMSTNTKSSLSRRNRDKNGIIGQSAKNGYNYPMRNR